MDFTKHLSRLVLTYEQSNTLKELGCDFPSQFYWGRIISSKSIKTQLMSRTIFNGFVAMQSISLKLGEGECFAYTAEEISNLLPKKIVVDNLIFSLIIQKNDWHGNPEAFVAEYMDTSLRILLKSKGYTLCDCLGNLAIEYFKYKIDEKISKPNPPEKCIENEWGTIRRKVKNMRKNGLSYREISQKLNVSLGFIFKWSNR